MTAFVEECRREWNRLGVPELLADDMATELETDLSEAEADGVTAAEMLGESDPRRFAATWARERGLVDEPAPERRRRRRWIFVAVGLVLGAIFAASLGLFAATSVSVQTHVGAPRPRTVRSVVIPNFVGLKACHAKRIAIESGLEVRPIPRSRCDALVVAQKPLRGTLVQRPRRTRSTVTLRLRG